MKPDPVIEVRNLGFRHPATFSKQTNPTLKDVNLSIRAGEILGIAGRSGSGKSTFCYCLNGLIPHLIPGLMTGTVTIQGEDTRSRRVNDIASHVALVFQNPADQLFSSDVEGEVAFGAEQLGWDDDEIERAITLSLDAIGIADLRKRDIAGLSWGERQKVAIAAAFAVRPAVLLLDEPFSGIDHGTDVRLVGLIAEIIRALGTTVIIAEQRLPWLISLVQRMVVFDHGTVVYDGDPGLLPEWYTAENTFYTTVSDRDRSQVSHRNSEVPAVSFRNVIFRYPGRDTPAISVKALDILNGEITVLHGPNGSGKSTFIRLLNGLLEPGAGDLQISGRDIRGKSVAEHSRSTGVLLQHADYQLFADTIFEELAFGPQNHGIGDEEVRVRIREISSRLSIDELGMDTPPLGLSAGEKQRVAIGSILTMKTPIIALDEPTLGLDRKSKRIFGEFLKALRDAGSSVIVATHDEEFSRFIIDRAITIENGVVVSDSRIPECVMRAPGNEGSDRRESR
ncbi:MAG: energy-coupling factor ABC transporter ATP-binding protein [Methanomicrobiales archaeon]|nr:energy-coupling factor ABC transporter ATP-binding protein [Methanomicrobiales archaeon]